MYIYKKRKSSFRKITQLVLCIIVISGISIFMYDMYVNTSVYSNNQPEWKNISYMQNNGENKDDDIASILENNIKCVVGVSKIKNTGNSIFLNNSTSDLGLGTGIVVSSDGYILTNSHVAGEKYSTCYITLENGNIINGSVKWSDKDLDLAIVKTNASGLSYAKLGDSDNIKIGEEAYAIGNPIGVEFQRTVTSGIISGINRTIKIDDENGSSYMEDLIQTDALINPGNSGGPLVNSSGEVIGINSVKITEAEGIGFAVPINIVKPVIEKFLTNNEFNEAYIGIFAYDKNVISYLNSNIKFDSGIYVAEVSKDGPSFSAGLKTGDIITRIDDLEVNKMSTLRSYIYTKDVGEEVILTILRGNKEYEINVKLGKKS